MVLAVTGAEYIKDYKIKLVFSDKNERIVDFKPFLEQSRNPMTRKFLDLKEFKNFTLEYGDLVWNDYEMCFPVIDLYEGRILKNVELSSAA